MRMSSPLNRRVTRLECQRGLAPGQCPLCDHHPRQVKVVFPDDPDDGSPRNCPHCGRSLYFVVEFE